METENKEEGQQRQEQQKQQETSFSASFFFEKLEQELLASSLAEQDNDYNGIRTMAVMGDFFFDSNTHKDYERGIIIKGKPKLRGKTLVVARADTNGSLDSYCEISGLGVYMISYAVSWIGDPQLEMMNRVIDEYYTRGLDLPLCKMVKQQLYHWTYLIADIEPAPGSDRFLLR